jgi:hypothetical protein
MGLSKSRRAIFLAEHPVCCFCGGGTPAKEPDHVPSRVSFREKQWPEGYEFPACVSCNRATRDDEQVVAMLARMFPDPATEIERAEAEERIRAVAHNFPEILIEMQPSVRQLRNATKKYDIQRQPGMSYADIPALSVKGPLVNRAVMNFGRKLFCALYYKHSGLILGPSGGVAIHWFSNLQIEGDEIPRSLATVLKEFPKIERSRTNLDDQFFYRWGMADTKEVAAFLAFFRRSFAMLGYVNQRAEEFGLPDSAVIVRPYVAQPRAAADISPLLRS